MNVIMYIYPGVNTCMATYIFYEVVYVDVRKLILLQTNYKQIKENF